MVLTAGLDVGGAHLKLALLENGRISTVRQIACPLWRGFDRLDDALADAAPSLAGAERIAVTMTGELSDLFEDRQAGVAALTARLVREFDGRVRFWMGARGFGSAETAGQHPGDVGSTNFLATATFIARNLADALLIDFGSTTTDIIPVRGGSPVPRGLTDAERQSTGELVYTGFTRTAVMGVAREAPFRGERVELAREYLATMADVRRILGVDLTDVDQHATADGRGKSTAESITRLARMLGRDARDGTALDWAFAAAHMRELQLRSIHDGALRVLSASGLPATTTVVAAGIGSSDAGEIARRLGAPALVFGALAGAAESARVFATHAAPAVAVAHLLAAETA